MMKKIIVDNRLTISSTTKSKVEKLYKVERKHRRTKNKGRRHFTKIKTQKLNRNNIRDQLSDAYQKHVVNDEITRKFSMVDSVNVTLGLYYSKKIF